jgi:hypothetical protein
MYCKMCCLIILTDRGFRGVTQTRLVGSPMVLICELPYLISLLISYAFIIIHIIYKYSLLYLNVYNNSSTLLSFVNCMVLQFRLEARGGALG